MDEDSSGTLNTGDTDVAEYTWDYRNRLVTVTNRATYGGDATQAVDYIYDVNNRLVGKILDPDGEGEEGTSEEYYVYDGDQILLRFDGPNTADLVDRYLWAPTVDLLLSDEKLTGPSTPGDIYWALGDNLNTVRDIARYNPGTDTTTVVNHRVYDAFGKLTSETNPAVDLIFSFTGRLFDEATGLQSNWRRWYDPAVGRWLSEDPIGFQGGDHNLYRYVGNRVLNATDPTGLMEIDPGWFEPPNFWELWWHYLRPWNNHPADPYSGALKWLGWGMGVFGFAGSAGLWAAARVGLTDIGMVPLSEAWQRATEAAYEILSEFLNDETGAVGPPNPAGGDAPIPPVPDNPPVVPMRPALDQAAIDALDQRIADLQWTIESIRRAPYHPDISKSENYLIQLATELARLRAAR